MQKKGCPYDDLFIYYLEGRVTPGYLPPLPGFIGNWEEQGYSFLFYDRPRDEAVYELVKNAPGLKLLDRFQMTYEQWQGERVTPYEIAGFNIIPPWEKDKIHADEHTIFMDPGIVFGTGTHPTTRDVFILLSGLTRNIRIESAIDLGCGTGLLTLGAVKMGIPLVLAVDSNPLAAKTTKENICLNHMENSAFAVTGRAEDMIFCPADLLLGNIHYDIMKKIVNAEGFIRKKWFILSGLLRSEAGDIVHMLKHMPVEITEMREAEGVWHTIMGKTIV